MDPTAIQNITLVQDTPSREIPTFGRLGLGTTDQVEPFQYPIRPSVLTEPANVQNVALVQDTPPGKILVFGRIGIGVIDQVEPFQDSVRPL